MSKATKAGKAEAVKQIQVRAAKLLEEASELSQQSGVEYETLLDAIADTLDGVNIPDEETELIREQAEKDGKTFRAWCEEAIIQHLGACYFGHDTSVMPYRKKWAHLHSF